MQRIMLLLILALLGFAKEVQKSNRFPHKLWLYWHDPNIGDAPIFVQLCINNIRHYAAQSGWEVTIVNNYNIGLYITQQSNTNLAFLKQRIPLLIKAGLTSQALSDLFRAFLLHDNGGMWVDISSVFLQDLSWVQNLEEFQLVENSIAKQPQILMYTSDMIFGGNKTVIFNEKKQRYVYLFPGLQFWSVIAKPQTKFFNEMIQELLFVFSQESFSGYMQNKRQQGFLYMEQANVYFAFSTIHFQTILQRKQKEIDRNPENFNIKYSVEYYGIWSMNSLDSAYSLFFYFGGVHKQVIHQIVNLPFASFPQKTKKAPFLKFNGGTRGELDKFMEKTQTIACSIKDGGFKNDTFFNLYLFRHSEGLPYVKKIRSLQKQGQSESQCTNSQLKNAIQSVPSKLLTIMIVLIILIACFASCLLWIGKVLGKIVQGICCRKVM